MWKLQKFCPANLSTFNIFHSHQRLHPQFLCLPAEVNQVRMGLLKHIPVANGYVVSSNMVVYFAVGIDMTKLHCVWFFVFQTMYGDHNTYVYVTCTFFTGQMYSYTFTIDHVHEFILIFNSSVTVWYIMYNIVAKLLYILNIHSYVVTMMNKS